MNTTGCPERFARDDVLGVGLDPAMIGCGLSVVAFGTCLSIYCICLLAVAVMRTRIVHRNRKKRSQKFFSSASRIALLTLAQSWLSSINYLVMLIVFFTFGTGNNVFELLLGIGLLLFCISNDLWTSKLVRLGTRIIGPPMRSQDSDKTSRLPGASVMQSVTVDLTREADSIIKVLVVLRRISLLLQTLSFCVLCLALQQRIWLRLGAGLFGVTTTLDVVLILWQYHRSEHAMIETQRNVQSATTGQVDYLDAVKAKFMSHRIVLTIAFTPGIFIIFLSSAEVLAISYLSILIFGAFDVCVNAMMVLSFTHGRQFTKRGATVNGRKLGRLTEIQNTPSSPMRKDGQEPQLAVVTDLPEDT